MDWVEVYEMLSQIERQHDLFNLKIQDVLFWERVRFQVYSKIIREGTTTDSSHGGKKSNGSRIKRLMLSVFRVSKNPFLSPKSSIIVISSARRKFQGGVWWDIYSDLLIDRMQDSIIAIESHFDNKHYSPAKTKNLRYFDFIEMRTYLKRILRRVKIKLTEEEYGKLEEIRTILKSTFGVSVNLISMTKRTLQERKARLPLFLKLLMKIEPEIVILTQGYGWEDLIEACKKLGVVTIELQHGVISPYHVGYSFPNGTKKSFADYLFVWGDYWRTVADFPVDESRIISVGFPYLEMQKEEFRKHGDGDYILFISQDTIGEDLSKFAAKLSTQLDLDHEILYKLHPQEVHGWQEKYPWLLHTDINVIDRLDASLYELFSKSKVIVGVGSTALYEGLAFGLRTFIVDIKGAEIMNHIIQEGFVESVKSPEDLIGKLSDNKSRETFDTGFLFKSNAIENMISEIQRIRESHISKEKHT